MKADFCILNDVTRCIACEQCVAGCKKVHQIPLDDPPPRVETAPDGLTATRWTSIVRLPEGQNVRKQCRHCLEPACVTVCPVGALVKTDQGAVVWDKLRCIGCRYCMIACPYGVPRFEWESLYPEIRKCTLCQPEITAGTIDKPGCVSACPEDATVFGTREEMLAEARRRIAEKPELYIDHIWGEKEVGGTRVLMISDVELDFLAWGDPQQLLGDVLPARTGADMAKVPYKFVGMLAAMGGLAWFVNRRRRVAAEEAAETAAAAEAAAAENTSASEEGNGDA